MHFTLEVVEGAESGRQFYLDREEMIIGRGLACHVVLNSLAVSRTHARLVLDNDTYAIEDLGSRYHTYVNGEEIGGVVRLKDNDQVRIADSLLVFHASLPDVSDISEGQEDSCLTIVGRIDARSIAETVLDVNPEAKLRAILKITRALGRTLDLESVLSKMLDGLFEIYPHADRALVLLIEGDRLVPRAVKHRRQWQDSIQYSKTIVRQAIDQREAILSRNAAVDERFTHAQSIADFQIRSIMCVPLLSQDMNSLGAIHLDTRHEGAKFTDEDMHILTSVASQPSISVEYAQLHKPMMKQARLQREMDIAQEMQKSFLPRTTPELAGYEFWAYYLAAGKVGGDYYDFLNWTAPLMA